MNKSFADPEFPVEFKKLMGDGPAPLSGDELERAIKELPRDKEVVQLYQKLAGADPLPAAVKQPGLRQDVGEGFAARPRDWSVYSAVQVYWNYTDQVY